MNASADIDKLERMIRELRIDYERFFNGALELPPETLRTEIQAEIRRLRNASLKGVEDNFRLSNLEAKLNSLSELSGRRIRAQEEGRGPIVARPEQRVRHDPQRGVVIDGSAEAGAVEALYQRLHQTAGNRPRFDLESFRSYIDRQLGAIRQKTGARRVVFRIAEEQGKMKLKARPLPDDREG